MGEETDDKANNYIRTSGSHFKARSLNEITKEVGVDSKEEKRCEDWGTPTWRGQGDTEKAAVRRQKTNQESGILEPRKGVSPEGGSDGPVKQLVK